MDKDILDLQLFFKIQDIDIDNNQYEVLCGETATTMAYQTTEKYVTENLTAMQIHLLSGRFSVRLIILHIFCFVISSIVLILKMLSVQQYSAVNIILLVFVFLGYEFIKNNEIEMYYRVRYVFQQYLKNDENKTNLFMVRVKPESKNPLKIIDVLDQNHIIFPDLLKNDQDKIAFIIQMIEKNQIYFTNDGFSILCTKR